MLRHNLVTLEKYEGTIDDVCVLGRYARNILQRNKNKTKSMKMTQWRLLHYDGFQCYRVQDKWKLEIQCLLCIFTIQIWFHFITNPNQDTQIMALPLSLITYFFGGFISFSVLCGNPGRCNRTKIYLK